MPTTERDRQLVTTADGRSVCFAEWGDPAGFPVVLMHGTPGGRYNRPPDEDAVAGAGVRLVTYDRPGYGRSDRLPGRVVVDCVADVAAIVDHLGLDRYAVTGSSGGGPHVLAAAAHGGDRMVRARCNVGLAPYDADGLDYYAGMDPMNVEEFGWALDGEQRLVPEVERLLDEMRERMAADATKFISDDWKLDEADRAVMADPRIVEQNRVIGAELVECGQWGWVDDDIAFVKPWGFDLGDIVAPVQVCYGLKDVLVPPGHGEWLARHIPQAEVVVNDASGHLTRPDEVGAIMHWLVSGKQPA